MALDKPKILAAAQKQLARGNVDRALKELGRIVRDDPKDLRVRQKIAELLARQGKISEAMREFQVVAEAYERGGFFPKAAAIYKQMLRFEPNSMQWHLALGEIYQQLALLSDAADHFNIVANHFDNNGTAKERIEIYERLVRLNPDSLEYAERLSNLYQKESDPGSAFDVWAKVAQVLEQRNDLDTLTTVYERMSALRDDDLDIVRALANLYLDRNDPRRALAKLQHCFRVDPQDTETLNLLADAFVDLGEREKAVAVLRELAQIYDTLGYEEYRNQVYDRITEIDPSGGTAFEGDASLVVEGLGNPAAGINVAQEGSEEEPIQRSFVAAETFVAYGFPDKARDTLEAAVARFPSSFLLRKALLPLQLYDEDLEGALESLDAMYEVAMDHSDYGAARGCLTLAVDINPEDTQTLDRLRAFEEALGEFAPGQDGDAALDDFGDAIELGSKIAGTTQAEPDPFQEEDREDVGDFDFNANEMQALARQLREELDEGSDAGVSSSSLSLPKDGGEELDLDLDLDLDDDPFAGLDLDDLGGFEPEDDRSALEIGQSYYAAGSYDDAKAEFERAVSDEDQLPMSLELLGVTNRRLHDFRGAVECFRRLLAEKLVQGDDQLKILFEIGVTYEAAGNRKSAYKVYKKIVGVQGGFRGGEAQNRLSSLELELGLG